MIPEMQPKFFPLPTHPPAQPDAMGENNICTAFKGCRVKINQNIFKNLKIYLKHLSSIEKLTTIKKNYKFITRTIIYKCHNTHGLLD